MLPPPARDIERHIAQLLPRRLPGPTDCGQADTVSAEILRRVLSLRFRRAGIDANTLADTLSKIRACVRRGMPIRFAYPCGGYKLWSLPSYPGIDWAEVFNVAFVCDYLSRIAEVYEHGAEVTYTAADAILQRANNVPRAATDEYCRQFNEVLTLFNDRLPGSIRLHFFKPQDLYGPEEFEEELAANLDHNRRHWENKYSQLDRDARLKSAESNLMRVGVEDLTLLSAAEWSARVLFAAMLDDAYLCLRKRREFNKGSERIQLVNVRGPSLSIPIRSSAASCVQFWVGYGVLEVREVRLLEQVLSRTRYREQQARIVTVPIESQFTTIGVNLRAVPVLLPSSG